MPEPIAVPAAVCLNMIVRNEAHVVRELLDSVAPYIASWVIVDTGSEDGTQDIIQRHLAERGIPGVLHERPWRNFGHNRSEALTLAQGSGDYIWVMDADDVVVGAPDFGRLHADVYSMRHVVDVTYWRPRLFRDGLAVRYEGVTHEYPRWEGGAAAVRLDGGYHIADRQISARNLSGQKLINDRDLLSAEIDRDPEDRRSVFYLAQTYFAMGDLTAARHWYARRIELGGWDQEVYSAMLRLAEVMERLDEPWPEVQDAYLQAYEFRPTRAEPLYAIACRYRVEKRYQLGYLFAGRAAAIPLPEADILFVRSDIHAWRALDEQAVCAFWIGEHAESFSLYRRLLARPDVPEVDRQRIWRNRDFAVPAMVEAASVYPDELAHRLVAGSGDVEVTVSLTAGPDRESVEQTLNSFLNCCTDIARVGRFLAVDVGLSARDRSALEDRYGFLEFLDCGPAASSGVQLARLREQVGGRFWLHLGHGWRFFAPEKLITRLTAVLEADAQVFQVGINYGDVAGLSGSYADHAAVRRTPAGSRYVMTAVVARGPAVFDAARLDRVGPVECTDPQPIAEIGRRAAAIGLRAASLDEVFCIVEGNRRS